MHHTAGIMALNVICATIDTDESSNAEGISCSSAHRECIAHVEAMLTWYAAGRLQLSRELIVSLDGVTIRYSLVLMIDSSFLERTSLTCWSDFSSLLAKLIYI